MGIWISIGVLILALVVVFLWLLALQEKLKRACYIERRGDVLLLKDFEGEIIEENIIIKIK